MHAPESTMPIPKANAPATSGRLTGEICAAGGKPSPFGFGKYKLNKSAYPIAPTAIAVTMEFNWRVLRSSKASRNKQKKQKRPRSNAKPSAAPISSDTGAFGSTVSLLANQNASTSNPAKEPSANQTDRRLLAATFISANSLADSSR